MTSNHHPQAVAGFTALFLRATQLLGDPSTPLERSEALLETAFAVLSKSPSGANSNQVTTLFALKVQLAEKAQIALNTLKSNAVQGRAPSEKELARRERAAFEAYSGVIEQGRLLLQLPGLWPSTRAYIYAECARCCASLDLWSKTAAARNGYHRSMLSFVEKGLNEISQVPASATKSASNRHIRLVFCQCLLLSADYHVSSNTTGDIHKQFWKALAEADRIAKGSKSQFEKLLLHCSRLFICRTNDENTQDLRATWARALTRLNSLIVKQPFSGAKHVVARGYQHLVAISRLTGDHAHLAIALLGLVNEIQSHPKHTKARDEWLSIAYESRCAIGDHRGAEEILTRCRVLNLQDPFSRTARLRLLAARKVFDSEPQTLLSQGAIYADLFRSVTEPTKESIEVSLRVAKILIERSADDFVAKVLSVFDLCQNTPAYRDALAESVQQLITVLAREDIMAPFMNTLVKLRPILPETHQSLSAVITIRQLIARGQTGQAESEVLREIKSSPRNEDVNSLRLDLHLLAAVTRLSVGKLTLAEKHINIVLNHNAERSEMRTRRKLLALALDFIRAFRKDDKDLAAVRYGELVEEIRQFRPTPIFKPSELRNSRSLATAIQKRILQGSLYEEFDKARFSNS